MCESFRKPLRFEPSLHPYSDRPVATICLQSYANTTVVMLSVSFDWTRDPIASLHSTFRSSYRKIPIQFFCHLARMRQKQLSGALCVVLPTNCLAASSTEALETVEDMRVISLPQSETPTVIYVVYFAR
jgi:hypothetical protein